MSNQEHNTEAKKATPQTAIKLLFVVFAMFGFGFALVPLYDAICDVTGLNGKTGGLYTSQDELQVDKERSVRIQFIASNNAGMPWEFHPDERTLVVHPGEQYATTFYVRNPADRTIIAQAIPSVSPNRVAEYLHKTECFCFSQQELAGGESLEMPLRFIIDPALPADVKLLTLSYTLFDVTEQVSGKLAAN